MELSTTKTLGHFSFEAKKVTKTTLIAISANLRQKCVLDQTTERVQKITQYAWRVCSKFVKFSGVSLTKNMQLGENSWNGEYPGYRQGQFTKPPLGHTFYCQPACCEHYIFWEQNWQVALIPKTNTQTQRQIKEKNQRVKYTNTKTRRGQIHRRGICCWGKGGRPVTGKQSLPYAPSSTFRQRWIIQQFFSSRLFASLL